MQPAANRLEDLRQAQNALANGQAEAAARTCTKILHANPSDVEARHLLGRCDAAHGRWRDAAAEFRRALSIRPGYPAALIDLGVALAFVGEFPEARRLLENALSIDSAPAALHFGLGLCALGAKDFPAAAAAFRGALARDPRIVDAHNNLGVALDRLGRLDESVACFRRAAQLRPDFAMAHRNLGDALLRMGHASAAADAFQDLAAIHPADAFAHADLGAARLSAGDFAAAVPALEHALRLDSTLFDAACNLGEALRYLNVLDQATSAFRRALSLKGDIAEAHLGLGRIAATQGRATEAAADLLTAARLRHGDPGMAISIARLLEDLGCQDQSIAVLSDAARVSPGNADLHDLMGEILHRYGKLEVAVDCYRQALQLEANRPQTFLNLGRALESLGSEPEAIASIERSLSLRPEHAESIAALASCAFRVCDWALAATALARLRELPGAIACLHPFLMLASDMEPNELSQSLRQRGRELGPTPQSSAVRHRAEDPLRLAYLSPDFREHPVAHAVAGIIDKHDRQRFTPIGISLAAARSSAIAQRLKASFDEFIDASAMSDTAVGELMRQRGIDIAIDLAGHTTGARPLIFARRAAAMQVNYLGFPGSMGVGFMDFIVADEVVVPQGDEPLYTERVLRMPNSYLPFDSSRPPATAMGRDAAGLPSGAFVFCAFNNGYKINRAVFETWMSLLRETPGSILWLRSMGAAAANNLRTAAAALGVPTERLVFAPFLKTIEAHMRRLACADLFLDTLPYNAHTTAAEALWAGVPVVSCVGRTFAGRVGASLLSNAGLGELICQDLEQYRRCAVKLAQAPPLLRELRETLERTRNTSPVFDTQRYTRDFESLLAAAWRESGG